MTTHVGQERVSSGLRRPSPKKAGTIVPKYFGPPMYAKTVRPRVTKFAKVTHVGQERVSMETVTPQFLDRAYILPNIVPQQEV